jgi:hypothetical protein
VHWAAHPRIAARFIKAAAGGRAGSRA